jgi:glycosyltransferase involved in cell wall biosynthesis
MAGPVLLPMTPSASPRIVVRPALCSAGEIFGGVERHLLGLIEYLHDKGVSPTLVLFHDRELAARARAIGTRPVILSGHQRYDPSAAWRLARAVEETSANLVHAHGYKATVLSAIAKLHYGFAMVKTEHGRAETGSWRRRATWLSRSYRLLEAVATRAASATVCYVTEDLRRSFGRLHAGLRRYTVHNGIGTIARNSTSQPREYEAGYFNCAIVGRLASVKGITYAIEAFAHPVVPPMARLYVIGTGPLETQLQSQAAQLGIDDKVSFLGFRPNIYDYLAHCDALLIPSLHEGLPYTLLEAMSLGTPTIASCTGGLAEILEHQKSAVLLPPASSAELADAISQLARNPSYAHSLGQSARRLQTMRYSLQRMGDAYWEIYRVTLGLSS